MKEKLKDKKYFLGYALQIFGLVFFRAYLTVLINTYETTFLINVNDGIRYVSELDYSKFYRAFAVNIAMILVTLGILIYGIVFVVKNKPKSNSRFIIIKRILLIFILLGISAVIYAGIGAYSTGIGVHDEEFSEMSFPPAKASVAISTAKIKLMSSDENTDEFLIETKILCKENKYLIAYDRINTHVIDGGKNKIIYAGAVLPRYVIWQEKDEGKFPVLFISGSTCYWDENGSFIINKNGSFTLRDYLTINDWWINILPFMNLYTECDYLLEWRSEDISYTFELLPEYFVYAKEFGSYTHIEKYADIDYETNYVPVVVPAKAERKMVKGSLVCVKNGAADYYGTNLFDYVYDRQYIISQLDGDRAVIVLNDEIIAAMNIADLYFAKEFY